MEKHTTKNPKETQKLGEELARNILSSIPKKSAVVLGLQGDLGSGKTTFLQGFAKGLGIKENVLSPTFILMKRFELRSKPSKNFYHFDCYRLNESEEILHLGFEEIIADSKNIVAIEWPEKISNLLPKGMLALEFKHVDETTRELTIIKWQ